MSLRITHQIVQPGPDGADTGRTGCCGPGPIRSDLAGRQVPGQQTHTRWLAHHKGTAHLQRLEQALSQPREKDFKQTLCADIDGFSLHAAVRCGAEDRQALAQLCRYITRPALANERVQTNAAGQVVLKLKTAWRDGTAHLVMSPLEFMQRLAALVPRPRLHLIRFHGVLAPNAKLRAQVVPQKPEAPSQEAKLAECEANCAHHQPVRLSWAKLVNRVFEIDMEHCRGCGGELKTIAAILGSR